MAWLVSEVPAVLSSVGFAVLLAETWKVIYGNVEGQPHQILFGLGLTSVKLGLGLDVSPAMAPQCKNAIQVRYVRIYILAARMLRYNERRVG